MPHSPDEKAAWQDFVRTGSLSAYMRYREIAEKREGE